MTTYVFLNCPSYGHVNPTLPVVQELVERGEKVIYYLTEEFRGLVEATGATLRVYDSNMGKEEASSGQSIRASYHEQLMEEAEYVLPQVLERVCSEKPDIIVYDPICFWARIILRKLQIPAVLSSPGFVMEGEGREALRRLSPTQERGNFRMFLGKMMGKMSRLCTTYDVEPFDLRSIGAPSEGLHIVFLPREFQPGAETLDQRYRFVGPAIQPALRQVAFPLDRLKKRQNLYISQGTVFNNQVDFFKTCIQAFGETHWQVVLATGKRFPVAALDPLPANFIVQSYVPQLEVLSQSTLFINHGGINSTLEALYYGVPLVMAGSQIPDQLLTAQRVVELGLGKQLQNEEINATRLCEVVEEVSNDSSLHARVRQMQEILHQAGGHKAAADAIVEYSRASAKKSR
jgi:MGT family glycosyltransferase